MESLPLLSFFCICPSVSNARLTKYNIELTNSFAGDSIAVYLNDSLLLDQTMPDANLKVEIKRFAEDNVLMVVDNKTDKTTPFNLNPEGSRVEVKKSGDVIYILEREADSLLE